MQYNPDFHHRHSIRFQNYNYSNKGMYFITICVQNHECLFGIIQNNIMTLNNIGKIVENEILKTSQLRKNVYIDKYVVMPNHIHMIIDIQSAEISSYANSKIKTLSTQQKSKLLLPKIIQQYKSATVRRVKEYNNLEIYGKQYLHWQRNYHDHLIRNKTEHLQISSYISHNPYNWVQDNLHK